MYDGVTSSGYFHVSSLMYVRHCLRVLVLIMSVIHILRSIMALLLFTLAHNYFQLYGIVPWIM